MRHDHQVFAPRLIFGLGIVLIGVIYLLSNLGIVYATRYIQFWPVLFICVGLAVIIQGGSGGSRFWGAVLVFVGGGMILDRMNFIDFNPWNYWPILLVVAGANLVYQSLRRRDTAPGGTDPNDDAHVNGFAMMSGFRRTILSKSFRSADFNAVMGGVEVDLRRAEMEGNEATINVFAFWGGIELKVPEHWTVVVKALPIMGGVDDKTVAPSSGPEKRLVVVGTVIMGGVEIRN
jgi:predicted membrane protein